LSILITGASGFLGGRLAQLLARRFPAHDLVLLARPASRLAHLDGLKRRIVVGDLGEPNALDEALMGVTRVFHCAACSTDWAPRRTYERANVEGTRNLVTAALRCPTLDRFVHVSTTDVYGYPAVPCDETTPAHDAGLPYNQTKILAEEAVWRAHREHGLPVTIVRPATIYGPRGKDFTIEIATLLRQRLMATLNGGRATGGFAYVDNVADAMIAASSHPGALGQAFNLSDGTNATWAEYLSLFAEALGTRRPWIDLSLPVADRFAGVLEGVHRLLRLPGRPLLTRHAVKLLGMDQEFPAAKARAVFGFEPKVSLEDGIAHSVAWLTEGQNPKEAFPAG
jgi:nucleoside-diphosphate-sugar epimerase